MSVDLKSVACDAGYPVEAFVFVQRGLEYTVRNVHGPEADESAEADESIDVDESEDEGFEESADAEGAESGSRHVSGAELCYGLRDFACEEYGLMAKAVLRSWGVVRCADFGRIVFAMIDAGMMRKTDEDSISDFEDVFDFSEAFSAPLPISDIGS